MGSVPLIFHTRLVGTRGSLMRYAIASCAIGALALNAAAQNVTVTFENVLPSNGMAFSPVFLGLHNGSFDPVNSGAVASQGIEDVAELGNSAALTAEFAAAVPGGLSQTAGSGPITGGNSASANFAVGDPAQARFLTFASMFVPSNDLFIGNDNGIEIFDAAGNFVGPFTITIFGSQVWDAGTEVNNATNGAAFLEGVDVSFGADEGGTVGLFLDRPDAAAYLASITGQTTAPGFTLGSTFAAGTAIAQITVVPAPSAMAAMTLALGAAGRRRRR